MKKRIRRILFIIKQKSFSFKEVTNPVAGADLVAKGTDAGGCVNEDMMVQGNRVLLESRYECQFQKQVK